VERSQNMPSVHWCKSGVVEAFPVQSTGAVGKIPPRHCLRPHLTDRRPIRLRWPHAIKIWVSSQKWFPGASAGKRLQEKGSAHSGGLSRKEGTRRAGVKPAHAIVDLLRGSSSRTAVLFFRAASVVAWIIILRMRDNISTQGHEGFEHQSAAASAMLAADSVAVSFGRVDFLL